MEDLITNNIRNRAINVDEMLYNADCGYDYHEPVE